MDRGYHMGAGLAGIVFIVLGVIFMLEALDVATFRFELLVPGAVIALGLAVILGSLLRPGRS